MFKRLCLLLWLLQLVIVVSAQPAVRHRLSPLPEPENFYVIKARKDAEFNALRKELGERFLREEGTGYSMYQQWVGYWEVKLYPHGKFQIAHEAMNRIGRANQAAPRLQSSSCTGWSEIGPLDMPLGSSWQRGVGQVGWIAFDPANINNVFTGSPKGGLFYSTDAGGTWQSGGTDFLQPNIGAAHLAVDPTNGNRWFLATGDGRGLNDSAWNTSHGVYRTSSKGLTWDKIGLDLSTTSWTYQIKKLVIAPNNPNVIFAATSAGLYGTTNALDLNPLNVSWTLLPTGGNNNQDAFYDIEYQPGSTSTLYASGASLVRSTDGGVTWSPLPANPFGPGVLRMAMDVSPANPDYLYVVVVQQGPAPCNGNMPSSWLYRFDVSSGTWTDKGPICNTGSYGPDQRGVSATRADSISVSPSDANLIYLSDVRPARCTTGGTPGPCTWVPTTTTLAGTVHDDIAKLMFTPDGLTIYAASDGGVFKTTDGGGSWMPLNKGLRVATSLRMSTSPTDPTLIMNGLFDDGTVLYKNGFWQHVLGGDGLTPIIDHIDPSHLYASLQTSVMVRSDNMGSTFPVNVSLPCPNWWTYAALNSSTPSTIFGACQPEVLRSTDGGVTWSAISQFAAQGMGSYEVWKIYTAPSSPDVVYAHMVSGTPQLLMRTSNANQPIATWQAIGHPSAQWITDIDVDETDPGKFWLTYGGFSPPDQKVYYYDGANWHNLTSNLANIGVNSIVHERGSDRLFIGTHIGVYTGSGTSPNWIRVGTATAGELPYVEVNDLEINYVNNKLRAGTFGRGMWEIALDPCLPTVAGPDAMIRDSAADVGNQPNDDSGPVLWASDDIWVRNTPDQLTTYPPIPPRYSREHQHENPEFSPIPVNTPYVFVKVHNRGNQPVSGKVHLYWANASTALDWQFPFWTEITPVIPSTTDVVNLAPGGVSVASLQWTNIPSPQLSVGGHFCVLARFVADASTPDPITGEVTGNAIWGNVFNSNNIAWKNVTIVNDLQNLAVGGQVIVRNISLLRSLTQLRFDLAPGSEAFLRSGTIEVDLGKQLFALWQRCGGKGSGVKAIGPTTIAIRGPHASIDALELSPREEHVVTFRFSLREPRPAQTEFTLHVIQNDLLKNTKASSPVTGGETFVIQLAPPK